MDVPLAPPRLFALVPGCNQRRLPGRSGGTYRAALGPLTIPNPDARPRAYSRALYVARMKRGTRVAAWTSDRMKWTEETTHGFRQADCPDDGIGRNTRDRAQGSARR